MNGVARRLFRSAAIAIALAAVLYPAAAFGIHDTSQCEVLQRINCVDKPTDYKTHWDEYTVACVEPNLYATAPQNYDESGGTNTYLYPEEFAYAWVSGSTNLEKYLKIRCLYQDDPAKMAVALGSYIGFPVPIASDSGTLPLMSLFVYELDALDPEDPAISEVTDVRVPSFETWFKILEDEFDINFGLEAQKEVVLNYSKLRVEKKRNDVISVFTKLTGCKRSKHWKTDADFPPTDDLAGCNDSYLRARAAAGGIKVGKPTSAFPNPPTTEECFDEFRTNYVGKYPLNASAFRAITELCQGANSFNTGVGLGYNPMPNPFICKKWRNQTVADRYTGREYIVPNSQLKPADQGVAWEAVALNAVIDNVYDLRGGYCD